MSEQVLAIRQLRIEFPELFKTVKAVRGFDLSVRRARSWGWSASRVAASR